ncbi:hypothetical protein J3T26_23510 [Salmonella enterica]|uniref:hypothetical protein n=1 Tax=Salmonella enterica TaxID=28901 RepID=UPI0021D4876F|nr:hypothetical protein [Salmonella enterica]MCU7123642.1 hypothetical protein [Salmonella enterica]
MKPTSLHPGQRVLVTPLFGLAAPYHGTFIRRIPNQPGQAAYCVIRLDGFVGPDGCDEVPASDDCISRQVQPLEARE